MTSTSGEHAQAADRRPERRLAIAQIRTEAHEGDDHGAEPNPDYC